MQGFAKMFRSMYDGTLADDWKAMIVFQQLLVLCDARGEVDMTHGAISRTTGIPLEIIRQGVCSLEAADPQSRTPTDDGRRIRRLDEHRDWGWTIVNHTKYRNLRDLEQKRATDRERVRKQRAQAGDAKAPKAASRPVGKTCPVQRIAAMFDEILPELRSPVVWNESRMAPVRARWGEMAAHLKWESEAQGLEWFAGTFKAIRDSKFLMGRAPPRRDSTVPFALTFDWMFKPANFTKVIEGAYHGV